MSLDQLYQYSMRGIQICYNHIVKFTKTGLTKLTTPCNTPLPEHFLDPRMYISYCHAECINAYTLLAAPDLHVVINYIVYIRGYQIQ